MGTFPRDDDDRVLPHGVLDVYQSSHLSLCKQLPAHLPETIHHYNITY